MSAVMGTTDGAGCVVARRSGPLVARASVDRVLNLARSVPIFPCKINKQPLVGGGFHAASQDVTTIRNWWAHWPDALVGVPTGKRSGLFAIDVDSYKQDAPSQEWIAENTALLMGTRYHETPRGGRHYIFRQPKGFHTKTGAGITLNGRKLAAIDVRGDGGFVVFWPLHGLAADGTAQEMPKELVELFQRGRHENGQTNIVVVPGLARPAAEWKRERRRVLDALKCIDPADHDTWVKVGMAVHLASGGSDFDLWHAWSAGVLTGELPANYTGEVDCRKRWESFRHETAAPVTLGTIFELARQSGYASPKKEPVPVEKRPLQREVPPASEFPVDALGNILGDAARALQQATQAPIAICGSSVLAAAALAVQAHADVQIDGRIHPLSEFFITVGNTGERKSAVDNEALKSHREYEKSLQAAFTAKFMEHKLLAAAYERVCNQVLGTKDATVEERAAAAYAIGQEPMPPLDPLILCEEPTFQGLTKNLAKGQPSQGLFSDEGGRFLNSYAMSSDNAVATLAGLSKLWDGKPLDRVRAGDGATKLYGRRLSLHLMVQPGVVDLLLGNSIAQDQGYLSRCLLAFPDSTIGTRMYHEVDLSTSEPMKHYHGRMDELLHIPLPVEDLTNPVKRSQLNPRKLAVTGAAKRVYIEFHDAVERDMAGELKELRAFANKAPEHLLRLAGTLALVENDHAREIAEQHDRLGAH